MLSIFLFSKSSNPNFDAPAILNYSLNRAWQEFGLKYHCKMAKTKTKSHNRSKSSSKHDSVLHGTDAHIKTKPTQKPIEDLLTEAASLLEQSQPDLALPLAEEALRRLEAERAQSSVQPTIDDLLQLTAQGKPTLPITLALAADIYLAVGDSDAARKRFEDAVRIDPDGALVSADPLLWLAQLSDEGGKESILYFEKGCDVLRNEIEVLQESVVEADEEGQHALDERRAKLADALCGMTEVYMDGSVLGERRRSEMRSIRYRSRGSLPGASKCWRATDTSKRENQPRAS